jgi:hypothetical protein
VPNLVKIGPVVLEKKSKMQKFIDKRTTDNGRSEAVGSGELKTLRLSVKQKYKCAALSPVMVIAIRPIQLN